MLSLFAILQKYDFSSKSQQTAINSSKKNVVCDTAKVRFFKQITTQTSGTTNPSVLFAILQKYDFSSKSQLVFHVFNNWVCCLRYCKSTIFQANHNQSHAATSLRMLFAILQKYDFSSKSQRSLLPMIMSLCCLRYCKSTIFQANHNKVWTHATSC